MSLEDDVRSLSRNPTLALLDHDALRQLAVGAETRRLRKGDILFRRDEASDGGYVLVTGTIALDPSDTHAFGQAAHIVRPPTLIGDMALLTKTRRPVTAVAREQSTVIKISRNLFLRVLNESPRSAERLRRELSERLVSFMDELDSIAENGTEDR